MALEVEIRVNKSSLIYTVSKILEVLGESTEDAVIGANTLVGADIYGHETHGINSLLHYISQYREGKLQPQAKWEIVRETAATATIDANGGHTIILGVKAMDKAINKAKQYGVGAVTLFNSGHSGAVGQYVTRAVAQDMVGISMSSSIQPSVAPTDGMEKRVGTNPIAIGAPAGKEAPYHFDGATSVVSGGKLEVLSRRGKTLPPEWIMDHDGSPLSGIEITPGIGNFLLLPLGGSLEGASYKGDAFGMIPEILGSLLSGSLPSFADDKLSSKHFFCALNISAFTNIDNFKNNMDKTLRLILETKPIPGRERVIYAGVMEHEAKLDAEANGIPLQPEVLDSLCSISKELSVPVVELF